jgi:hypothetical protein
MTSENPNAPREHSDKPANPQQDSTKKKQNTVPPTAPPKPAPTPDNSYGPCCCHYQPTHWSWRIVESVGILAVVAYAVITYCQWKDLRHNFEADERSWVKVEFKWTPIQVGTLTGVIGILTNAGKSPITTLYGEGAFEVVDGDKTPSFTLKQHHSTHYEVLLFPSDHSEFPINLMDQTAKQPRSFTAEEVGKLKQGQAYIAAFGWIGYTDQFGLHWYRFCDWRAAAEAPLFGTVKSADCVSWNKIGDGKPDIPIQ